MSAEKNIDDTFILCLHCAAPLLCLSAAEEYTALRVPVTSTADAAATAERDSGDEQRPVYTGM